MTAYLGVNKIDTFRASDLRGVLSPLKELALRNQLTVLIVAHFNKNVKMLDTLNRISDSVALGAIARHVYATLDDVLTRLLVSPSLGNNSVHNTDKHGFRYEGPLVGTILVHLYLTHYQVVGIYRLLNEALCRVSRTPGLRCARHCVLNILKKCRRRPRLSPDKIDVPNARALKHCPANDATITESRLTSKSI